MNASLTPHGQPTQDVLRSLDPAQPSPETMQSLTSALNEELAKLGKNVSDAGRLTPTGGDEVNDLKPVLLDADGNGSLPPYGVSLRWTERLIGDYDQNGEVGLADLSKLGQYLNYTVHYDAPELHDGVADIPAGDPNDLGDVGPGMPPTTTSGAFNWRLAEIDGNRDGVIDIHDITPLAKHWHEAVTGYSAYRQGPQDADFVMMTNGIDPPPPTTLRRFDILAKVDPKLAPFIPVQYALPDFFIIDQPVVGAQYKYKVAPYCSDVPANGPNSVPVTVQPFDSQQGNDGVVPIVTATLLDANGKPTGGPLSTIEAAVPFTVRFDASNSYIPSGKTGNFLWDFDGDGVYEVSSGDSPTQDHTFTENGRFDASVSILLLNDPAHSASSVVRHASATGSGQIGVTGTGGGGNQPPVAKVKADKQLGTIPLTVHFDASTSTDSDGTIKFYEWDFNGDGIADFTSSTPTATYSYGIAGQFKVGLKVTDDKAGFATTSLPIITSNVDGNWPPSSSLIVNPAFGAAPLDVTLDGSRSLDPDGQIVKYEWDLNGDFTFDVDTGSQSKLDYTFPASGIFNVWLRITDIGGLTSLSRTTVKVNTPPFGGLEASPLSGPGPLKVDFDASTSLDLDGTIVKYEWDFNADGVYDQDTGTVPRVSKTLYKIGKQNVVVRLTDNLGFTATTAIQIEVLSPKNNLTPLASLNASVAVGDKPLTTFLTATGSDPDPDGSVDHYDWDFDGDGVIDDQTDILNNALQHTFTEYGLYHVTVWVVDNVGSETPATVDIKVWDGLNQPPEARFTVNPSGGPPSTPLNFSAASATDPENAITQYAWDFNGDGTFDVTGPAATARDVQHAYPVKGTNNVVLRVTDAGGSRSLISKKVVVGNVPLVKFVADRAYAEAPNATFNFDASRSQGADGAITNYEWDLDGDGTYELSTGVSPFASVTFQLSDLAAFPGGVIHPTLRATNEIGAVTEVTQVQMPALDALGQPQRDLQGNLLLDADGGVKLMDVNLQLNDNYDEVEGNDTYQLSNWLIGPGPGGSFRPQSGGDTLQALQPGLFSGSPVSLTRNDLVLGNYVEASLGQRNLGQFYDGDDDDWYAFTLSSGAHVRIDQQFDAHGSLDPITTNLILRLYDANGVQALAQAQTISGGPSNIDYDFRDPGTYYIRVNRFVGQGQDYKLFLKTTPVTYFPETALTATWNDGAGDESTVKAQHKTADPTTDNNDTPQLSDNVHVPSGVTLLRGGPIDFPIWGSLNKAGGDSVDWYHFYYASPVTVRVQALFKHALGDIDIFLYDQNLNLLGYSNSADDDETIWRTMPVPSGTQRAFIKVVALNNGVGGGATNYNLLVGYPPGNPTNLTAQDGSANGKIHVSWTPPVGGNAPNGYDLYVSDSQFGIYSKVAANLTSPQFDQDLSATANLPLQNNIYWYKVKATRTGEQDSDFSNADSGFVNGIKAAVGLTASDNVFIDHIDIGFFSAPFDPALGTGNFGVEPVTYRLYADPQGALPNTLIASFSGANDGTDTLIPALGGLPARPGKQYTFTFTGLPMWTQPQIRGVPITFTIAAERQGYTTAVSAGVSGKISGIDAPVSFTATQDVFPDKVRLSWVQPTASNDIYPDGYTIQYQGEFDSGWTSMSQQQPTVTYQDGTNNYDFYVTSPGSKPPARKYRIRSIKAGIGSSPWVGNNAPFVYGWPIGNGYTGPSFNISYGDNAGTKYFHFTINPLSQDAYCPTYYKVEFWRFWPDGGLWNGWKTYDRNNPGAFFDDLYSYSYGGSDNRYYWVTFAYKNPYGDGGGYPSFYSHWDHDPDHSFPGPVNDSQWIYTQSFQNIGGSIP